MKQICFEGYSDDTFGYSIPATGEADEYDNCSNGKPIDWLVRVPGDDLGLIVRGDFGRGCSWCVGVAALDDDGDDLPIPPWPIRIERSPETPYSPRLIVEAPDRAVVSHVTPERP